MTPNLGWICPKCGSVYAPTIFQCWYCGKQATTSTKGTSAERLPELPSTISCTPGGGHVAEGK